MVTTLLAVAFGIVLIVVIRLIVSDGRAKPVSPPAVERRTPMESAHRWTDAVELGVAIVRAMPESDDGEIMDRLESIGIEPWLAERLVIWVPAAFAERVLASTDFGETYSEAGTERLLAEDPIWTAARARAARANDAEAMDVASRSAAMSAARAFLASDSGRGLKPSEMTGSSVTALMSPLQPIVAGDGGVLVPRDAFASFLDGHGLATAPTSTTAMRAGELEIDALVVRHAFSSGLRAQVDFVARHPRLSGRCLVESFSASGATYRTAMADAIRKFERGSLHVILAALVDETSCAEQVTWEEWPHPSGVFRACLGAQLLLWAGGEAPVGALIDALRLAIVDAPLDGTVHAIRVFAARDGERSLADEVLLDGEPWEAGEALCRAHAWPLRDEAWATRVFLMLVPSASHATE